MRENERLAFWLTPLAAALPLIPFFSIRASPWFLGKLMRDPAHPMSLPGVGPWLSATGVVFDGTILGYVMIYAVALPIYLLLERRAQMSLVRLMILFCLTGVFASQVVHFLQNFRQRGLEEFADGWMSPLFGCLCGGAAGLFFSFCSGRRIPIFMRPVVYALPAGVLFVCGFVMVQSARLVNR